MRRKPISHLLQKSLESLGWGHKKDQNVALAGGLRKASGQGNCVVPQYWSSVAPRAIRSAGQPRPWTVQPLCGVVQHDLLVMGVVGVEDFLRPRPKIV